MKFFKNKQQVKSKPVLPRAYDVINKEYIQGCAALGQMKFKLDEQLLAIENQSSALSRLNAEGVARKELDDATQQKKGEMINRGENE